MLNVPLLQRCMTHRCQPEARGSETVSACSWFTYLHHPGMYIACTVIVYFCHNSMSKLVASLEGPCCLNCFWTPCMLVALSFFFLQAFFLFGWLGWDTRVSLAERRTGLAVRSFISIGQKGWFLQAGTTITLSSLIFLSTLGRRQKGGKQYKFNAPQFSENASTA